MSDGPHPFGEPDEETVTGSDEELRLLGVIGDLEAKAIQADALLAEAIASRAALEANLPAAPAPEVWSHEPELTPGVNGGVAIVGAMVEAMAAVGAVGKDGLHNVPKAGKWNYRSADAVISAVQPALVHARIALIPSPMKRTPVVLKAFGKSEEVSELELAVILMSAVDASSVRIRVFSHASGMSAYTIGASYSYALKYALTMLLCIPFDDSRMDLESNDAGQRESTASAGPAAEPDEPWHIRYGFRDEAEHKSERDALIGAIKALPENLRVVAKNALASITVDDSDGASALWLVDPDDSSKGRLSAMVSASALAAARKELAVIADMKANNAAGPTRGRRHTGPAPAPEPSPGPDVPPEPSESATEATGLAGDPTPVGARQDMHRVFLGLGPDDAAKVTVRMTKADLWPIDSISDERAEEAADLMADILEITGEEEQAK
jgi:hypothetical protein